MNQKTEDGISVPIKNKSIKDGSTSRTIHGIPQIAQVEYINVDINMSQEKCSLSSNRESMREQIKQLALKWCKSVTSHGLPRIIEADKLHIKIMWLFSFLVSVCLCSYMLFRSIQHYLAFEVITTTRVKALNEIELPMITICNINDFVKREANDYMQDYFDNREHFNISKYFDKNYQNVSIATIDDPFWLYTMRSHPYFDEEIKKSFTYWPRGFIKPNPNDYNWYFHPWWGNCFKFNSGLDYYGNEIPLLKYRLEGRGVEIELFVNPSDLFVDYNYALDYNGIYVSVEHQDSKHLEPDFFEVRPGTNTRVKLSKVVTESMPSPYGNCVESKTIDNLFARELRKLGFNYTRKNCIIVCMQKLIIDKYGCYGLIYPKILDAEPCTHLNLNDFWPFSLDECFDNCPYECSSIKYDLTISTSEYPSKIRLNSLMSTQKDFLRDAYKTNNITPQMVRNSYARLLVYYHEIKETHITESESMSFVDLIANIGGTLGLFIGTSLLSFFEFIEFILNLVGILIESRLERSPKWIYI